MDRRQFIAQLGAGSYLMARPFGSGVLPNDESADGRAESADYPNFSGIFPHLAFFNEEGECGTGAVVPWADRLWAVTYAPHRPTGSTDKLYEINEQLDLTIREESIGGTPANRMIHRESSQLFIGPYVIDADRTVRVIGYDKMFGRPTGMARHLEQPEEKIYLATMEEGLYEIEVGSLEVTTIFFDEAITDGEPKADLPGYHGKGLYSGQGRLIYANNGERGREAQRNPFVSSGVLAEWDEQSWQVIERLQFTEVTGPGGIYGNQQPDSDPIWSIGWDAKSLILMVLDQGAWKRYRLPKASHSYDGAHGWNTEWPRIRDIGEDDALMTMHGMFWKFPKTMSHANSSGIRPRSSYLKVVGDFCRWRDKVVLGCDDTARNEFLNTRRAKGEIEAPQSQSNLWFVDPEQLDRFGTTIGRGGVWLEEDVVAGQTSDPFLFAGFPDRGVHFHNMGDSLVELVMEIDDDGSNSWEAHETLSLEPGEYRWHSFPDRQQGEWIRLRAQSAGQNLTAWFAMNGDEKHEGIEGRRMFRGTRSTW